MTNDEINQRVALALGWLWQEGESTDDGGGGWIEPMWRTRDDEPTYSSGLFCRDPAAADLVRQEIERRGWMLTRIDYKSERPLPAYPSQHRAQILTGGVFSEGHWGADDELAGRALCIAFLAACEAST